MAQNNRQERLIMALILIVGGVVGYMYYSQIASVNVTDFPPLKADANDGLTKFKDIVLNFQVFDSGTFQALRTFGESPVSPGKPGKPDLFSSF